MVNGSTSPVRGLLVALLAAAAAASVLMAAPDRAAAQTTAVDNFGGCLVSQRAGDLLILVDESQSLQQSDPDDARVTAAGYLATQLADFSRRTKADLDVLVTGFSSGYSEVGGWNRLGGDGTQQVTSAIDSFADREDGYQTDYWTGLDSARSALAAKADGSNRCQAIVWFTDGKLDLSLAEVSNPSQESRQKPYAPEADLTTEQGANTAADRATRDLCRNGGIADQLRRAEVALFAVGLRSEATDSSDFALMKSIATGSDGCGQVTDPEPGSFVLAANIDELLFAFDRLRDPSKDPIEQQTGVCQGSLCTEYRHNFVLDDSISSVHVLGTAPPGLDVYLVPPQGEPQRFRPTPVGEQTKINAAGGSVEWLSDRSVSIDLERTRSWAGQWAVVFVDPEADSPDAKSRTNIHISGDVYPTWANQDKIDLRSGEVVKGVRLGLIDGEDKPIKPTSLLGSVSMNATLVAVGEQINLGRQLGKDELNRPRQLDLREVPPGPATLRLQLSVRTAGTTDASGQRIPGTELAPQQARIPITVAPPPGYPQLGELVDFGAIEGPADTAATIPVTGPGCVWLPADAAPQIGAGPSGLGDVSVTSRADRPGNCVRVGDGDTDELRLRLTTAEGGNGTLDGTVAVRVAPEDEPDRARTVQVPFTADLDKPLNPVNFLLALIVALILGPGIPLGLLYLAKYLTAKIPPRALLARRIPVEVHGDQLVRDGHPFALRSDDLQQMVRLPISGARTAEAGGFTLRTRVGRSPFGAGFTLLESPGLDGVSGTDPEPYGTDRSARLPLAVHNTWALLHDPSGPPEQATVLILLGTDFSEDPARRAGYADDIAARAPGLLQQLRSSAGAAEVLEPAAPEPFGGSATGAASSDDPFGLDQPEPVRRGDHGIGSGQPGDSGPSTGSGDVGGPSTGSGDGDGPSTSSGDGGADPFDFGWSDDGDSAGGNPDEGR